MDFAAANGHLEIVQWLHVHTTAGCTTYAMNFSAAGGHLALLRWLDSSCGEGCTAMTLESAMSNGHLEVACWIRQHYPDFVPTKLRVSSSMCAFNVLLFVRSHYPGLLREDIVRSVHEKLSPAFQRPNDVQVVEWLKENYPVPDISGGPPGRFDGLAGQGLANIAGQIAGQHGDVLRVLPDQDAADQQGRGMRNDGQAVVMNNVMMVVHRGDDSDDEDEDM